MKRVELETGGAVEVGSASLQVIWEGGATLVGLTTDEQAEIAFALTAAHDKIDDAPDPRLAISPETAGRLLAVANIGEEIGRRFVTAIGPLVRELESVRARLEGELVAEEDEHRG